MQSDVVGVAFNHVETGFLRLEILKISASESHRLPTFHCFHLHPNVSPIPRENVAQPF